MNEDGGHLFFKCKLAKQVWRLQHPENVRADLEGLKNARETVELILRTKKEQGLMMVLHFGSFGRNGISLGLVYVLISIHVY